MRPQNLSTKIFLDSSSLEDMDTLKNKIGFLDGETTNPSNFVKSLKSERGGGDLRFTKDELYSLYKERVQEISKRVPDGSVSIEVYADTRTTSDQLIAQGKEMFSWIPNAHIKLPVTVAGLSAAEQLVAGGVRVNMTLCFNQEQAAAVYSATRGAVRGNVFISPFIGRLDDKGQNGVDLIKNIVRMYANGDGHVEVLAASIRNSTQLSEAIAVGTDITTSSLSAIVEWADMGMVVPALDLLSAHGFAEIPYQDISLNKSWSEYDIQDSMTDDGLLRFADDWNNLLR